MLTPVIKSNLTYILFKNAQSQKLQNSWPIMTKLYNKDKIEICNNCQKILIINIFYMAKLYTEAKLYYEGFQNFGITL